MAEKTAKTITVVKGPKATGKVFGFRIAPKNKPNKGRIEISDKPVKINLETPEALKCGLEAAIDGHVGMGFLKRVEESE
jgi:hypothetical protein